MKVVALFGGSFNPPHVGHEAILRWLCSPDSPHAFDAIWVLPAVVHAFDKDLLPFEDRAAMVAAMVEALVGDDPRIEILRREERYTVETLEALHGEHPNTKFSLVLGADILADRAKWHRWSDVCRLAPPLYVSRKGSPVPDGVQVYPIDAPEVSSTQLRAALQQGTPTDLIPAAVQQVIQARGLYPAVAAE